MTKRAKPPNIAHIPLFPLDSPTGGLKRHSRDTPLKRSGPGFRIGVPAEYNSLSWPGVANPAG